uniref:Uncharacterized protein n=1 Tax=Corvus moneduloides TaxID=1196302 RepID=A0A8U7M977_CORMO
LLSRVCSVGNYYILNNFRGELILLLSLQAIAETAKRISTSSLFLIIGVSQSAGKSKVSPKKIMLLNHHDNGRSPYLAPKINGAKALLESSAKT